jgi:hypothetical protein
LIKYEKIRVLYEIHASQRPGKFDLLAHASSPEIQALAQSILLFGNALRDAKADDPPTSSPTVSQPRSTPDTQETTQPSPFICQDPSADIFNLEEYGPVPGEHLGDWEQLFPLFMGKPVLDGQNYVMVPEDCMERMLWRSTPPGNGGSI